MLKDLSWSFFFRMLHIGPKNEYHFLNPMTHATNVCYMLKQKNKMSILDVYRPYDTPKPDIIQFQEIPNVYSTATSLGSLKNICI